MRHIKANLNSENLTHPSNEDGVFRQKNKKTENVTIDQVTVLIDQETKNVFENTKDEINKQVQTDKASLITVFGLFASILSFLTIEFQFLKTLDNIFHILGFSCMLWALLVSFNLGLSYLINDTFDSQKSKPKKWLMMMCCLLMIIGIIFIAYAGNPKINKP